MGSQGEPDHSRASTPPALQPPPIRARGQGSQSPPGGSMEEVARPRRGLRGPEGVWAGAGKRPTGLLLGSVRVWAQRAGHEARSLSGFSPHRPSAWARLAVTGAARGS